MDLRSQLTSKTYSEFQFHDLEKFTDKCGNEEIARFLYYQCKLNANISSGYIRWIPFDVGMLID